MGFEAYESSPYPTAPHVEAHPSTLQTIAAAFGLNPPAIETARVLELGCATGGNIVPMACALPAAKFVGIDYSPRQIEAAEKFARGVGASNLRLETKSILDVTPEFGQFDYIIAHGIFSWVSDEVRAKLLSICRDNLSDDGVAMVSFNCYPGWHVRQWLRNFAQTAAPGQPISAVKIAIERAMNSQRLKKSPIIPVLQRIVEQFNSGDDTQWLHDLLEENNQPFYFKDFVARVEAHGLSYLADAITNGSAMEEQDPQTRPLLESAGADWVRREQTLDFLRNNSFRRAVLVKQSNVFERQIQPKRFEELFVSTAMRAEKPDSLRDSSPASFREGGGSGMVTSSPLTKTAIARLGEVFPKSLPLRELLQDAPEPARARTIHEFILGWMQGVIDAWVSPPQLSTAAGDRPEIWRIVRYQASIGQPLLTNLRHEVVKLDVNDHAMIAILQLLDGTRTREDVVVELAKKLSRPVEEMRPHAMKTIETILQGAGRLGVLVR